jgi:calcium-translocating P-type ATPase
MSQIEAQFQFDQPAHASTSEECLVRFEVGEETGLSLEEADKRARLFGPNALPEMARASLLSLFFRQFKSPLIYLLLLAAAIALFLGEVSDAVVILVVVTVNALIGMIQEGRAVRSLESLKKLSAHKARVRRGGKEAMIESRQLVPGDILLLSAGEIITADARLISSYALEVSEAALTGESAPVSKTTLDLAPETPLADRRNSVFSGTHVTAGRAVAVVCATGIETEVGQIARLSTEGEDVKTPLERKVTQFSHFIILASAVIFALIMLLGLWRGLEFSQILMIGISQIVSMVPEGLPVAMTVALAVGVTRMSKRKAIVRKLSAVETLGSTNVICTDKTGTLTRNEMTVQEVFLPGQGRKTLGSDPVHAGEKVLWPEALMRVAVLCNDSQSNGDGDPTEIALLRFAEKSGVDVEVLRQSHRRYDEIPFDPAVKLMVTEHRDRGEPVLLLKGAPERLLALCGKIRLEGQDVELDEARKQELETAGNAMAEGALRLLAFAEIRGVSLSETRDLTQMKDKAVHLGLIGQMDPPREEAYRAVRECQEAGIRPVMITGDHEKTGHAIGKMLGIVRPGDRVIGGQALERMSDQELSRSLHDVAVFARVHPAQKLRIVRAFQAAENVVAMTGDGVNDAPALAKADVGVAMGRTGTEVAKEASKIVITDDNFATIVDAIREGRIIYRNIKKLILYLFTTGLSEIAVLMGALIFGYAPPLAAVQILWVNLVTDGALTFTLIMEREEGDEMRRPPTRLAEPLINASMIRRMLVLSPAIAASTMGYFFYAMWAGHSALEIQTGTFTVLVVCQWFNVFNCRSETQSAFKMNMIRNKWLIGGLLVGNLLHAAVVFTPALNQIFYTTPIPLSEAFLIGGFASLVLWVEEIRKFFVRRRAAATARS